MIRFAFAAIAMAFALSAGGAQAQRGQPDPYRWCADYAYGGLAGARNCYFMTLEQCRATVSGVGGTCVPNPFFTGDPNSPEQPPPRSRTRRPS